MKSKRALDISALPPIENLKSVLSATGALNRCSNMGRLSIKGITCVISWREGLFSIRRPLLFFIKGTGLLNRTGCHHLVSGGKNLALGICLAGTAGPMVRQLLYSMKLSSANPVFHCKQNSHLKYYTQEIMTVQERRLAASK